MKYLLLLAIILIVLWLLRSGRRTGSPDNSAPRQGQQQQEMVQCPVCLVHLPRSDALPGPDGRLYCCAEHRLSAER